MPKLADQLKVVADRYSISLLYVFGSRASEIARKVAGEALPAASESDVDMLWLLRHGDMGSGGQGDKRKREKRRDLREGNGDRGHR